MEELKENDVIKALKEKLQWSERETKRHLQKLIAAEDELCDRTVTAPPKRLTIPLKLSSIAEVDFIFDSSYADSIADVVSMLFPELFQLRLSGKSRESRV